ncbi:hypothetical protein GO986_19770 [Deinococcus sp. HMF7620]|uniref:Peripheral subunit-binding (PSBD) domain-containing protein n=1 Tax=Deinococcus arboris TaxID=2682977 RepID=A0A7C9MB97_9DEIO|nr:E3 binding domain-containing protein [Deinococcus arboris]MVN88983.1 hypothetical protein [Deinococcus arboris]
MERIAPLAQVLAEANGIDWQRIQGSGAGGQIVEQDILNYLSRVMSGEEDPPDTPVDLPPPDWNGEEVPSAAILNQAGMNADMLSRAGVDTDLTAFVEQTRTASPEVPATPAPSNLDEDTEFELDDEPEVAPAPVAAAPVPTPPVPEPVVTPTPEPVMPAAAAPMPEPTPAPVTPPPAAPAAPAGGLSSLLSRLYQKPAQPEAAPAPAPTPMPEPVATPVAAQPELVPTPVQPEPVQPEVVAQPEPTPVSEPTPLPEPVAAQAEPAAEPVQPEPTPEPVVAEPEPVAPTPEPEPAQPEVAAPPEPAVVPTPAAPMPAAPVPVQTPAAPAQAPTGGVWFGTYLRRGADVAALYDLRDQVSRALSQELPLGLLVARAAQRHADTLGLSSVALDGQGRTHTVGSGSLRDAMTALDTNFDGTPDLLVVDAAALDLDDLHYPQTVTLSVGRTENGRATLSLNGDVETARAAQFLAQVAGTLEQPILLVL